MKYKFLFFVLLLGLVGCTEQERAKNFGGTATETLPPKQKLVNITWKEDHLWLLTRPMWANESPEVFEFKELSSYGILQGTVIIRESN